VPIYEYKCHTCGEISELFVQGTDAKQNIKCSSCESTDVEKLLSVPSILKDKASMPGHTCCGRTERCDTPPCSSGGKCHRG
jgi:putative FmdB family regulatory protein